MPNAKLAKPLAAHILTDAEIARLGARVAAMVAEHDDLDSAIAALLTAGTCDDLLITRLKKRKLHLKDEITLCAV